MQGYVLSAQDNCIIIDSSTECVSKSVEHVRDNLNNHSSLITFSHSLLTNHDFVQMHHGTKYKANMYHDFKRKQQDQRRKCPVRNLVFQMPKEDDNVKQPHGHQHNEGSSEVSQPLDRHPVRNSDGESSENAEVCPW